MTAEIAINGIACLAALWFARHHSAKALHCAIALTIGWMFYVSAWLPHGYTPNNIIKAWTGESVKSQILWAFCDFFVCAFIAERALTKWWGIVLYVSFAVQSALHVINLTDTIDFATYSNILDKIFIVQIAVFIALGWPNVRHRVIDFTRSKWHSHPVHKKGEILPKGRGE